MWFKRSKPPRKIEVRRIRVAAYCRVSKSQDKQFNSLQAQADYYMKLIQSRGDWEYAGIYADQASGRCNKKMPQFQKMMGACREGLIDLILTKSVSRFGRNTLEMLMVFNEFKDIGINVFFDVEKLSLKDSKSTLILTIYSALAQGESETRSFNIRWGIRKGFRDGTSGFLSRACYGYRTIEDGNLVIFAEEAKVVRKIFQWRSDGDSLRTISKKLKQCGIKAPRGGHTWRPETLRKLLANEKYSGNVLLQKTFVEDVLNGKQVKNNGQLARFFVHDNHPAVVVMD
jgi:DNA invertase Pin-like site-specific DNA recombinase